MDNLSEPREAELQDYAECPDPPEQTTEDMPGERVNAGAAYLDGRNPVWFDAINLETLDMEHPCLCILGQLAGNYSSGYDLYGIKTGEDRIRLGFFSWVPAESVMLRDAWRAEILARRSPKA